MLSFLFKLGMWGGLLLMAGVLALVLAVTDCGARTAHAQVNADLLYAIDGETLYVINSSTLVASEARTLSDNSTEYAGLAWDGLDFYSLREESGETSYRLVKFKLEGAVSVVGDTGLTSAPTSMVYANGNLYTAEVNSGRIQKVNPSTAAVVSIATASVHRWHGFAWTGGTQFYGWTQLSSNNGEDLRSITISASDTVQIGTRIGSVTNTRYSPLAWDGTTIKTMRLSNSRLGNMSTGGARTGFASITGSDVSSTTGFTSLWTPHPPAPDAPTLEIATGGITAAWTAPSTDVVDYDIQYRIVGDTLWTSHAFTGPGLTTTITGLQAGGTYEVQVKARNSEGFGPWSESSAPLTISSAPSRPNPPVLIASDTQIGAVWSAPDNNGAEIDDYNVRYRPKAAGGAWVFQGHVGIQTHTTIALLMNDVEYEVQVQASNAVGDSLWSLSADATPTDGASQDVAPSRPDRPMLTPGDQTIDVMWMPPLNLGPPITDYDVRYRAVGASGWSTNNFDGITLTDAIDSLTNGTEYEVQVRADNGTHGAWSESAMAVPVAPSAPDAPAAPLLTPGDEEIGASWDAPNDNNSEITDYQVRYKLSATDVWTVWGLTSGERSTVITGVENSVRYDVQVLARNAEGDSPYSATSTVVPVEPPDPAGEEELFTTLPLEAWTIGIMYAGETAHIQAAWDPVAEATGYILETRDNGIFRRTATVSDSLFRAMENEVTVSREPGRVVANTQRPLTHVIMRVRAYQMLGGIERYSPWTEERIITFPKVDYDLPEGVTLVDPPADMLGAAALVEEIADPLGFDADGDALLMPLVFAACVVMAAVSAWFIGGQAWTAGGGFAGAVIFVTAWGVLGPIWFDVPIPLALAPFILLAMGGAFTVWKRYA